MKVKKLVIPVLTLVMIASQLSGCASTSKKELASMIDNSQEIVIEVETPDFEVQGEHESISWTQLGLMTSNVNTREIVDSYYNNFTNEDTGVKYGPFYVNKDGGQEGNNTLLTVLGNKYVSNVLNGKATSETTSEATEESTTETSTEEETTAESEDTTESSEDAVEIMMSEISQYLNKDYADLEESDYNAAMFNAYFELIPDSTPNYFNGGASLTRAEAMTLLMRAVTPVGSLEANADFEKSVSGTQYDDYMAYAAKEDSNVYISTTDSSLSDDNFAGVMTRGEYLYMVLNEIYGAEEVQSQDISKVSLNDCVDGGDIASKLKFSGGEKDRIHAACLQYALGNVEKGAPQELYKAVAVANAKGIISSETRWDEAITKAEAIDILVSTMQAYYEEKGYICDNSEGGTTVSLEADGKVLWEKQDANDMSCTEEEFIADYVKSVGSGSMTAKEFEDAIKGKYSIKYAKEEEEKEKQIYIDSLWDCYGGEDKVTCSKDEFIKEYEKYAEEQGDKYSGEGFEKHIKEKFGKQEETKPAETKPAESNVDSGNTGNGGNTPSGGGNSGGSGGSDTPVYTPPVQDEPVYTPPVQDEPVYTPPVQDEPVYTPPVDDGGSGEEGGLEHGGGAGINLNEGDPTPFVPMDPNSPDWIHVAD